MIPPEYRVDKRYSPIVQEFYDDCRRAIENLLETGRKLAEASDDRYTVVITPEGRMLYISKELPEMPACAGTWMDFPEEEWGISEEEYRKLPIEERATLEANEQLKKWVEAEFKQFWSETWCRDMWDFFWWDEGGKDLVVSDRKKFNKEVENLFNKCRARWKV